MAFYFKEVIRSKGNKKRREVPVLLIVLLKNALLIFLLSTVYPASKKIVKMILQLILRFMICIARLLQCVCQSSVQHQLILYRLWFSWSSYRKNFLVPVIQIMLW